MTDIMPDALAGANVSLVQGLRDLADFIEAHPDLPALCATAWLDHGYWRKRDARAKLTAVATALGSLAREERHGSEVEISGLFGVVDLRAIADVQDLRGEPEPEPDYEPIIGERS